VSQASDGGFIVAGNSYENFLGVSAPGSVNNLLFKVDATGALEWAVACDTNQSNETSIVVEDPSDNGFIAASYMNGGGLVNYPNGNIWIYKVSSTGNLVWSNVFGGDLDPMDSPDELDDIIPTSDGNFLAIGFSGVGSFSNSNGNVDIIAIKFNSSGTILWSRNIGNTDYNYGSAVVESSDGSGYIIAGLDYKLSGGTGDFMFTKIDLLGNVLWSRSFGGSGFSWPGISLPNYGNTRPSHTSLVETNDGGFVATGYTDGYGSGNDEVIVMKINSSGNLVFAKTYGAAGSNDRGAGVLEMADGDLMIAGATQGALAVSNNDIMLLRLNNVGDVQWMKTYDATNALGGPNEFVGSLSFASDGNLILTGTIDNAITNGNDILLWKTDTAGNADTCSGLGTLIPTNRTPITTDITATVSTSNLSYSSLSISPLNTGNGSHGFITLNQQELCSMPDPTACSEYVDLGPDQIFCQGNSTTLDAGSPGSTYLWSTSETTQTINVNTSGSYWVQVTNGMGCTDRDTIVVTVNPLPNVNLPAFSDVCIDNGLMPLNSGTPVGGTYSGTGVSGGNFNPATAGAGTHTITYTYTDGNSCTNSDNNTITVNPLPTVTLGVFADVCEGAASFALTGGSPAGGTYSGTGVTGGNFNPGTAGAGTHTITYTYTDGNGCTNSATNSITVNPDPTVTLANFNDVCVDAAAFALSGGSPAGGTYSGPGVSGGNFNPGTAGTGTHTITYIYTDGNGCSGSASNTITVNPTPTVTFGALADVCVNDASFALTGGSPAGGTYSGTGVSGGNFNPGTVGVGTHTITYNYTDGNGCSGSAISNITVNALPNVTLGAFADVCSNNAAFALTGGSPAGGTYSGPGVSGGNFNPATAGAGTHTITYSYSDGNGCTASAPNSITVNGAPNVTLGAFTDICVDATSFALTGGFPAGGTYSGPGVSGGNFDPATAGAGTHVITYDYTDGNGCSNSATSSITVNDLPTVTLTAFADVCLNDATFALAGGSPAGGTYSGPGVTGGNFDPSAAGVGTHTITYDYTDGNGCANSATSSLTVNQSDDPTFNYSGSTFCLSGTDPTPTVSGTTGGSFAGTGTLVINSTTGEIDLSASGVGSYDVTYTTAGICPESSTITVTITNAPDASFSYNDPFCVNDPNPLPSFGAGASAGTFSSTPVGLVFLNNGTGEIDLSASAPGTYTITNDIAASGGCAAASSSSTVTINALDDATFTYSTTSFCSSDPNDTPVITLPGGTFSEISGNVVFVSTSTGEIDIASSTPGGPYTITYTTAGLCPNTSTLDITITTAPDAMFTYNDPFCVSDPNALPNFGAGASAGTFSATPAGLVFVSISTGEVDIAASAPGSYTITNDIAASGGCAATSETYSLTINPMDDATFTYPSPIACTSAGNPIPTANLPGGTYSETTGNVVFVDPQTGEIDVTTSTQGGPYTITYTTNGPCPSTSTFDITITNAADASVSPAGPFCSADTAVFLSAATNGGAWTGTGITDSTNGTFDPAVAGVGTHQVIYTIAGSCGSADTIDVVVNATPMAEAGIDETICAGNSVTLMATGGGNYTWSTGDNTATTTVSPMVATTYYVTVVDPATNCSSMDSVEVTITVPGSAAGVPDSYTVTSDNPTSFDVSLNDTGDVATITIIDSTNYGTITDNGNGNFTYISNSQNTATDTLIYVICDANCGTVCDTAMVLLYIQVQEDIVISTGLSPNGDGINDTWIITGIENYPENNVVIINRWGDVIYRAAAYNNEWEGQTNEGMVLMGDRVVDGTYFYILRLSPDAEPVQGYIELRRN
jgi:gliding motility-associated-like protein